MLEKLKKFFSKKSSAKPDEFNLNASIIDLNADLKSWRRGITDIAIRYYYSLPINERSKLTTFFNIIIGDDVSGKPLDEIISTLDKNQLLLIQTAIETDFQITKH